MKKIKKTSTGNIMVPYNPKKYDLEKALSLFPYIEWTQHTRPEIGGTVYLYIGLNGGRTMGQQLAYEFEVLATDANETIDDRCCLLTSKPINNSPYKKCIRMKFIRRIPYGLITLDDLKAHGLTKHPQSQTKVPFELQDYINSVLR